MKQNVLCALFTGLVLTALFSSQGWAMAKKPLPPAEVPAPELPALTLNDCYQLSLKQSEALAKKKVAVEKTWGDFLTASSEAIGDADFYIENTQQAKNTKVSSSSLSSFTRLEDRERKFTVKQPLFQGFKAMAAVVGAGSLRKQRIYEKQRAEQLLFIDVADSFYQVIRYHKDAEIQQGILKLLRNRVKELKAWEQIGRSRLSEVVTAESRMRSVQADLAVTQGALAREQRLLEFLTGLSLQGRKLSDSEPLHGKPETIESEIQTAESRPDVAAAKQAVKTAKQGILVAQSDLWPDISLNTNYYEKREGLQAGTDWDLLFSIDIPLSRGGGTLGAIKKSVGDWKESRLTLRESKRKAEMEIKQAVDSWLSSLDRFKALEKALETSELNYKLQKEDYSRNLVSNLDVLEALESLLQTRLRTNEAYYDLKSSYWDLQVAKGNCCESISE